MKRKMLEQIFGEDLAGQVIAAAEEKTKELEFTTRYKALPSAVKRLASSPDPHIRAAAPYIEDVARGLVVRN
jgi:hypothetical protein